MKTIVGITGTTSVGKSSVAVQLAKILGTQIVSADSMQIYKGMDIGTAKITVEEMQGIVHHMIDIVEPNCAFSSFLYREQAAKIIDGMQSLPVVVGGTGFYFESLVYPPEFGNASESRRQELTKLYEEQGIGYLQKLLFDIDRDAYSQIDVCNYKRVIRAIEIAESGGSIVLGETRRNPRYNMLLFVLSRQRSDLYEHIDRRVNCMVQKGLIDEVRVLVNTYGYCNTPAFEAIGYKEIIDYLQGKCSIDQAIELIKLNTRHFAKRQISYFKRMLVTDFVDVEGKTSQQIAEIIYNKLQGYDIFPRIYYKKA